MSSYSINPTVGLKVSQLAEVDEDGFQLVRRCSKNKVKTKITSVSFKSEDRSKHQSSQQPAVWITSASHKSQHVSKHQGSQQSDVSSAYLKSFPALPTPGRKMEVCFVFVFVIVVVSLNSLGDKLCLE